MEKGSRMEISKAHAHVLRQMRNGEYLLYSHTRNEWWMDESQVKVSPSIGDCLSIERHIHAFERFHTPDVTRYHITGTGREALSKWEESQAAATNDLAARAMPAKER